MRSRHLIACGLAALSLAAAGCGEEKAEEARSGGNDVKEAEKALEEKALEEEKGASGGAATTSGAFGEPPMVKVAEGAEPPAELEIETITPGKGPAAKAGDQIVANYHGVSFSTGEVFDSSFESGMPLPVQLGAGGVIPGFEQGLDGMKVGERRQVTIPSELAYGPQGSPPAIGPDETLIFVLDLVKIG